MQRTSIIFRPRKPSENRAERVQYIEDCKNRENHMQFFQDCKNREHRKNRVMLGDKRWEEKENIR